MDFADADGQKGGNQRRLWNRSCVSTRLIFNNRIHTALIRAYSSICLLCGIRLKYVLELDLGDPTWTVVNFGIFGAIEPLLGIISASLPVLPPVFSKLKGYILAVNLQSSSMRRDPRKSMINRARATSNFHTENPDTYHFRRLDDNVYSLNDISHPDRQFEASSVRDARIERIKDPQNAISITTMDWVVQSKPDSNKP